MRESTQCSRRVTQYTRSSLTHFDTVQQYETSTCNCTPHCTCAAERPQRLALRLVAGFPTHKLRAPDDEYNAQIFGVNPMPAAAGVLLADFMNGTVHLFSPHTGALGALLHRTAGTDRRVYTALAASADAVYVVESRDVSRLVGPIINNERVYSLLALRRRADAPDDWRVDCAVEFFRKSHTQGYKNAHVCLAGRTLLCGVESSRRITAVEFDESGALKRGGHVDFEADFLDMAAFESGSDCRLVAGFGDNSLRLFAISSAAAVPALSLSELWRTQCPRPARVLVSGAGILVIDPLANLEEQKLWLWRAEGNRLELQQELRLQNELLVQCWCTHGDDIVVFNYVERELDLFQCASISEFIDSDTATLRSRNARTQSSHYSTVIAILFCLFDNKHVLVRLLKTANERHDISADRNIHCETVRFVSRCADCLKANSYFARARILMTIENFKSN